MHFSTAFMLPEVVAILPKCSTCSCNLGKKIKQATQLIFVARYLERIADHSTNVAEWVIYLATGERLRKK